MSSHISYLLGLLSDNFTTATATYILLLTIVTIRLSLGYFPTRTKWFGLFGSLGLLHLWLKHEHREQVKQLFLSTRLHESSTTSEYSSQ
jgi:hypothetical protein